jgi:hypothetical protein
MNAGRFDRLTKSLLSAPTRVRQTINPGKTCISVGLPCDWRHPSRCCSGSCRPPHETGVRGGSEPRPGDVLVCVDAALGCTADQNSCPAIGKRRRHRCPGLPDGLCYVSVHGKPFCSGSPSACVPCERDEDCVRLWGTGTHCVECEARCGAQKGSHHRACYREGVPRVL